MPIGLREEKMCSIKFVMQHDMKDCGAACLCMIASYYGKKHTLRFMREVTHTGQNGVTMQGLSDGAEKIGINVEAYEATTEELEEIFQTGQKPMIVHLKTNHFVVLYKVKKGGFYIIDPAIGKYHLNKDKFAEIFSGYVMMFEDCGLDFDQKEEKKKNKIIQRVVCNNWKQLLALMLMSWFIMGVSLCSSHLFQLLLDQGQTKKATYGITDSIGYAHDTDNPIIGFLSFFGDQGHDKLFVFMIALTVTMSMVYLLKGVTEARMTKRMDYSFMNEYVGKIFSSKIHDVASRTTGDYVTRTADFTKIQEMISSLFVSLTLNINLFVIGSILLIGISVQLYFVAMLTLILYWVLAFLLRRPLDIVYQTSMSAKAEMNTALKEAVEGIEIIKSYNIEDRMQDQLMNKYDKYLDKNYKGDLLYSYGVSGSALIEQISNLIVIFAGFEFINGYMMSLGELMTFFMLLSIINGSANQLLSLQQDFHNGKMAIERIDDIINMQDEPIGEIKVDKIYEIEFANIYFSYFGRSKLLENISFSLKGNAKMAIVGENGCGKSTLLRLIMGMEESSAGHIYINGIDISKVKVRELRNRIAIVQQQTFLFAGTLLYNITLGKEYSSTEIEDVCVKSGLDELIKKTPQGLNVFIDENGRNLSSGQKQSIAIARALLKKPDVLLLDEATSNMDEVKAKMVIKELLKLDIPCVFVTHDPFIADMVDMVIRVGK